MEKKTKYSKIIANYLYNDMAQKERVQFEKDLSMNKELASEFELQASAAKYLKSKIILEEMKSDPDLAVADKIAEELLAEVSFDEELQDEELQDEKPIERILETEKSHSTLKDKRYLFRILAAAVILFGIVSTTLIISNSSIQSLYSAYYEPFDETSLVYRGNDLSTDDKVTQGIRLYNSESYVAAFNIFEEVQTEVPDSPIANFYMGLSSMANEELTKAINIFEDHLTTFDAFQPEVKWYLALCYLNSDKLNEANSLLKDLSSYPGKYGEDSRKISKKLERKLNR